MLRKTVTLVLIGILSVGAAAVAYGTFYGSGFDASLAGVLGAGENEDDEEREGHGEHNDD